MVRGPMIAVLTAGWSSANAIAKSISVSGVLGQRASPSAASSLRWLRARYVKRSGEPIARASSAASAPRYLPRASRPASGSTGHADAVVLRGEDVDLAPRTRSSTGLLGLEALRPRRAATHCASTICLAGKVEEPK